MKESCTCARCEKDLSDKNPLSERRYCLAKDKDGKYVWSIFCLECEPFPIMGDHH